MKHSKIIPITTICNYEYFNGYVRNLYNELSNQYSEDIYLPTRLIRVLAEIEEDVSDYQQCIDSCACKRRISLEESVFYVDVLSFPHIEIYCSTHCAAEYMRPFRSIQGDNIAFDDYIEDYDVVDGAIDPIPNNHEPEEL